MARPAGGPSAVETAVMADVLPLPGMPWSSMSSLCGTARRWCSALERAGKVAYGAEDRIDPALLEEQRRLGAICCRRPIFALGVVYGIRDVILVGLPSRSESLIPEPCCLCCARDSRRHSRWPAFSKRKLDP